MYEACVFKEKFEDTKGAIKSSKYKDGRYNGQKKKNKRTNNDLLNNIQKEDKDRATRIPPKTADELRCSGRVSCSWSTSGTHQCTIVTNPVISHVL